MNTHTLAMAVQSETSTSFLSPPSPPPPSKKPPPLPRPSKPTSDRDFLRHVEAYLAKRDGVDKLLKISRYTSKLLLASHALPSDSSLTRRLSSFESSVGLSRKAFRLGKFIQDVNALRDSHRHRHDHRGIRWALEIIAYGGEGVYFFVEQLVWLAKAGLIDKSHARALGKVSAWAELVGYVGSVAIKAGELTEMGKEMSALEAKREVAAARGEDTAEEREEEEEKVRRKMMMKRMSVVQDVADALMAVADVSEGKGRLSAPLVVAAAGLLSALISTHKNWVSC